VKNSTQNQGTRPKAPHNRTATATNSGHKKVDYRHKSSTAPHTQFNNKSKSTTTSLHQATSQERFNCDNCGLIHPRKKCSAFGQQCFNCGKMHRFRHVCRQQKHRVSTVDQEQDGESSTQSDTMFVEAMSSTEVIGNECYSTLLVENHEVTFKVDTGAQVNILPVDVYYRIRGPSELKEARATLTSYTGDTLPVAGTCQLKCKGQMIEFYIANTTQSPILGLKSAQDFRLDPDSISTARTYESSISSSLQRARLSAGTIHNHNQPSSTTSGESTKKDSSSH